MKFGTLEYDLMTNKEPVSLKKKKKGGKGKFLNALKNENKSVSNQPQIVAYPQLPKGWVKPSFTGDLSLDETAAEIESKLKRTIVGFTLLFFLI